MTTFTSKQGKRIARTKVRGGKIRIKRVTRQGKSYVEYSDAKGTFKRVRWKPKNNVTVKSAKASVKKVSFDKIDESKRKENYVYSVTYEQANKKKGSISFAEVRLVSPIILGGTESQKQQKVLAEFEKRASKQDQQYLKDFLNLFTDNKFFKQFFNEGTTTESPALRLTINYGGAWSHEKEY